MDISVVVPTYKRLEKLKACLASLCQQDYPKDKFEIIVIDDAPDTRAEKVAEEYTKQHSLLSYHAQKHRGPAAARNFGARLARGQIIGFVDDDCTVDIGWASGMIERHRKNPDIAAVGGLTLTSTDVSPVLVSQFLSNCSIKTYYRGNWEVIFFPTCNVSFKRKIFDTYVFNETFPLPGGEDLEFFWRLFKDGHRFIWDQEIRVLHYREDTTRGFLKQAYIYGRGNLLVQYLHRDQPLLKELRTGPVSFWMATAVNAIKIPRFSYLLGRRLIVQSGAGDVHKKMSVFAYFALHKVFYLCGNIFEFFRIKKDGIAAVEHPYPLPRLLILDITHACNLQCRICDIWKTAAAEEPLDIAHVKTLLRQAKDLGITGIALSGGEALSRRDIFEIFDYARNLRIKHLGVLTNGILVEKHLQRLQSLLVDGTISLVISLDSLQADVHNQIRNAADAWQSTVESLKKIAALKKTHPAVNFNVITIVLNQNLEELPALAKFVFDLGANSLQYQALLPNNLNMAERKQSPFWVPETRLPVLDRAVNTLVEFKKRNPQFVKNSVANLSLIKKYYRGNLTCDDVQCRSGLDTVLVSNQGTATTCYSPYGDITASKLKDILASRARILAHEKARECAQPCLLPCFIE